MSDFSKVASALARRTHDTEKDKTTDLDIAQASHALKILREIASDDPDLVSRVLGIQSDAAEIRWPKFKPKPKPKPKRRSGLKKKIKRKKQKIWSALWFSTAYSRAVKRSGRLRRPERVQIQLK